MTQIHKPRMSRAPKKRNLEDAVRKLNSPRQSPAKRIPARAAPRLAYMFQR